MSIGKIYLASPLGFHEAGRYFLQDKLVPELEDLGFQVINPFDEIPEEEVEDMKSIQKIEERKRKLSELDMEIGEMNRKSIERSDMVLAVLEGSDVDSGTASEVGYAAGTGKKVIGYRSDFRLSSENLGTSVNLQVEYFIRESGGKIASSLDELIELMGEIK